MMTKHFSRFRSVIYNLVLIPILISLVSCFGEYDYERGTNLVNIVDNYLSVDFNGMTQNQLSEAQTTLMGYNIDLKFTTTIFDETEKLTEVAFDAWFPNGNNINASLNCSLFKFPFGLWYDLDCGACGSGILDDAKMYHFKKTTLERASQVNDANGQFYINGGKANYDLTINWVHSARKSFQSTYSCDTIVDSQFLILNSF